MIQEGKNRNPALEKMLRAIEKFIPTKLYSLGQPAYHYLLALCGALIYRFPSKSLAVIAVTGTKGKSTTVEILASIFREAGFKTASLSTIQFRIGDTVERNLYKMTTPGRFFVQKFLRDAVAAGCTYAVLEMTSEAAKLSRHKFIDFDAVILTNITPEHIESHGSFEKYREAKMKIARALEHSSKKETAIIINADEEALRPFASIKASVLLPYSLKNAPPKIRDGTSGSFQEILFGDVVLATKLPGEFNAANVLAAATYARHARIPSATIARGVQKLHTLRGRMEEINEGQNFKIFVDYAHTIESLEACYRAIPQKKICVLGGTGGGRDRWKRKGMGHIAEQYCSHIILTNEDPYDENPHQIIADMKEGISGVLLEEILDRRKAIGAALSLAKPAMAVVITGKGTDPYIMGPRGQKEEWDDANVVREELKKLSREKPEPSRPPRKTAPLPAQHGKQGGRKKKRVVS